jgi:hypothetical protein
VLAQVDQGLGDDLPGRSGGETAQVLLDLERERFSGQAYRRDEHHQPGEDGHDAVVRERRGVVVDVTGEISHEGAPEGP